jgi:hypothetical protein
MFMICYSFFDSEAIDDVLSMYIYDGFTVNKKHMEPPSSGRAAIGCGITPHSKGLCYCTCNSLREVFVIVHLLKKM